MWGVCTYVNGRSPLKYGGYAFLPEEWQVTGPKSIQIIWKASLISCPPTESKADYEHLQCIILISPPHHFPDWEWLFLQLLWKRVPSRPKLCSKRGLPHVPITSGLLCKYLMVWETWDCSPSFTGGQPGHWEIKEIAPHNPQLLS